jgi:FMN phosphatase YigB (HAD superfamily)
VGVAPLFDFVLTSRDAGVAKPAAGIFRLAAERALPMPASAPAEAAQGRCLHIGDHWERDVGGALGAGPAWHAVWVHAPSAAATHPGPVPAPDRFMAVPSVDALLAMLPAHPQS